MTRRIKDLHFRERSASGLLVQVHVNPQANWPNSCTTWHQKNIHLCSRSGLFQKISWLLSAVNDSVTDLAPVKKRRPCLEYSGPKCLPVGAPMTKSVDVSHDGMMQSFTQHWASQQKTHQQKGGSQGLNMLIAYPFPSDKILLVYLSIMCPVIQIYNQISGCIWVTF